MVFLTFIFYFWGLLNFFYALSRFINSNKKLTMTFNIFDIVAERGKLLDSDSLSKDEQIFNTLNIIYAVFFLMWCIIGIFFSTINWFGFATGLIIFIISGKFGSWLKNLRILYTMWYAIHWTGHMVFNGFLIINAYHLHINIFRQFF